MVANGTKSYTSPLAKSGALDKQFKYEEATPVVGREYLDLNIVDDILNAPNADELVRDLAITSKVATHSLITVYLLCQYPSAASSSFVHKIISPISFKRSSSIALVN
jgi:hypothetical protein